MHGINNIKVINAQQARLVLHYKSTKDRRKILTCAFVVITKFLAFGTLLLAG
jgi:uncharacterized membrane protein YobD (UPF0266 family)